MKKNSLFVQLYIILLVTLVIPTAIVSYYATISMTNYSQENIAESTLTNLKSISQANEIILFNVVKDVLRLSQSSSFRNLQRLDDFETLNQSYENVQVGSTAYKAFSEILYNDNMIHSLYFLRSGGDYVVSTDRGIVQLENYMDQRWLKGILEDHKSMTGKWISRKLYTATVAERRNETAKDYYVDVLSYVYPINSQTSSIKGSIIVNIYAEKIMALLNPSQDDNGICFLVNKNQEIIIHPDSKVIGKNISEENYMQNILQEENKLGYFFTTENNIQYIYAYSKNHLDGWTYVLRYDMNALMKNSKSVVYNTITLISMILAVGMIIVFIIAYRVSRPMRDLVLMMQRSHELKDLNIKNELQYLSHAFKQMHEQGEELHKVLSKKSSDAELLLLRELLVGVMEKREDIEELVSIFPYEHFIVVMMSIDNSTQYLRKFNSDERSYYFMIIEKLLEKNFNNKVHVARSFRYNSTSCAMILNLKTYDQQKVPLFIDTTLQKLKSEIKESNGYTFTVGVSGVHNELEGIPGCAYEAMEAVKRRIIQGRDSVIFWKSSMDKNKRYHYPYHSEKKIINYLSLGDYEQIKYELKLIREQILEIDNISCDNVVLIYNQLIGATIKYLVEHNINTGKIFSNGDNAYSIIATKDTVEEIEAYLVQFYDAIEKALGEPTEEKEELYGTKIIEYLDKHYKEEINFEDLAKKVEISYSYMRKLVKELTGSSLNDYINKLRIEEAKWLLTQTDQSIVKIASSVGYHNVQSINRFFKKYEGVTPREFRNMKKT